jgi:hypothetical protein
MGIEAGIIEYDQSPDGSFRVTIECDDDTSYEAEDMSIFADDDILDLKKPTKIVVSMQDTYRNKDITLRVTHRGSGSENMLSVSSSDYNWLSGVFENLEQIVKSTKPQYIWLQRFYITVLVTLGLAIAIGLLVAFSLGPSATSDDRAGAGFVTGIIFLVLGTTMVGWLANFFPPIELAIGPEHTRVESNRRKVLIAACTLFIAPLAIMVVYDVLKWVLHLY